MSVNGEDSGESLDEEYIPEEEESVSESDVEETADSDLDDHASIKKTEDGNAEELTQEEREIRDKSLWESFKAEVDEPKKSVIVKDMESPVAAKEVKPSDPAKAPATKRPNPSLDLGKILGGAKKPKVNTLEKSKQDWSKFVQTEGIQEDLKIFNKGKQGYLERKAFEARTELNQFEIMKNMRLNKPNK